VLRLDLDGHRVEGPLAGEIDDVLGEGGREQQRLAVLLARRLAHDALDLRDEAHVQHAVRLVEHQDLHVVEVQVAAGEVDQAPRGGHDQIDDFPPERLSCFW
jgi:hypothetical protein